MMFISLQVSFAKGAFEKNPKSVEDDASFRPAVEAIVENIIASVPEVPSVTEDEVKDIVESIVAELKERPSLTEKDVKDLVGGMLEALPEVPSLTEEDVERVVSGAIESLREEAAKIDLLTAEDVKDIASGLIEDVKASIPDVTPVTAEEVTAIVSGLIEEAKAGITLITEDDVKAIVSAVIEEKEKTKTAEPEAAVLGEDDVRSIIADILRERDENSVPSLSEEDVSGIVSEMIAEKESEFRLEFQFQSEEAEEPEEDLIEASVIVPSAQYASGYAADPAGWWNDLWKGAHFSYDIYAKSTMMRGENVPGGGISMGVETDRFRFESYGQADYFMKPLGGEGGVASMELSAELGMNGAWKFLEFWAFDVWAAVDVGYYAQILKGLPYPTANEYTLGFSGLMVRPKLMIELKIAKYYGLTLGVYYQTPVYAPYKDYSGLGILFSIC